MQELIQKVPDVNVVDEHGMSALHFAANAGHLEVVNVLLAANADVNAVDEVIYFNNWICAHCFFLEFPINDLLFYSFIIDSPPPSYL